METQTFVTILDRGKNGKNILAEEPRATLVQASKQKEGEKGVRGGGRGGGRREPDVAQFRGNRSPPALRALGQEPHKGSDFCRGES